MYFLYSLVLWIGFLLMLPLFLMRREKYAAGFRQRLGNYPKFEQNGRPLIWLHCVSVGETNAARPLVDAIRKTFPGHRLVFSTTTKTGQELAQKIFAEKADVIVYFPFDFKFSVRKALDNYKPTLVLLMETEIWPRFIREAKSSGAKIAIVNGRLSAKSLARYAKIRPFISRVLADVDLALMQGEADSKRLISLGISKARVTVTGNVKFDSTVESSKGELTKYFRERFGIDESKPVIVAASTHNKEEQAILDALEIVGEEVRIVIAPRHPERFAEVEKLLSRHVSTVRRSASPSEKDKTAEVVLLDSIGELQEVYPLADIVFVGGSLIPHGGQSILEPAAAGKAIITGPHTHNFDAIVRLFVENDALIQLPSAASKDETVMALYDALLQLLVDKSKRDRLGENALSVMNANRGATDKTIECLRSFIFGQTEN